MTVWVEVRLQSVEWMVFRADPVLIACVVLTKNKPSRLDNLTTCSAGEREREFGTAGGSRGGGGGGVLGFKDLGRWTRTIFAVFCLTFK